MKKTIIIQVVALVLVFGIIYLLYPKTSLEVTGNVVNFQESSAKIIIISQNPNFENAQYYSLNESNKIILEPGHYYWKASNSYLTGFKGEFDIDSTVGLEIQNESDLVNVGDVKLKVTKDENGQMVGEIVLEIGENEMINNSGVYTGRQDE
jgi:hypothetical protein